MMSGICQDLSEDLLVSVRGSIRIYRGIFQDLKGFCQELLGICLYLSVASVRICLGICQRLQSYKCCHNVTGSLCRATPITPTDNHPLISFLRSWNEFDSLEIKLNPSKGQFNRLLKNFFLGKLEENFVCERLLCPHCHL